MNPSETPNPYRPSSGPENSGPASPATPADDAASQPGPSVVGPQTPKKSRKKLMIGIIVLLLIAAGIAAYMVFKPAKKQTTANTKKDIPLLRVGLIAAGEVPQYPTNYPDNADDFFIEAQMFESLVGYKNQTQIVPLLATSWTNPNDTTWVFNIRQGVKFHSGRTLTAQDVKFSYDYAAAHVGSNGGNFTYATTAENIKQITVTGPYQVTITTDQPDPIFLSQVAQMGIVDSKATLGDYNSGTGPYVVRPGTTPTDSFVDLVAADNYWGGHVSTREVTITLYSDSSKLANDAAIGKFDIAGDFGADALAKLKNFKTFTVKDAGPTTLSINTKNQASPLSNVAAREAVAYAVNVPAILKTAGIQGTPLNQIVPPEFPGYNPAIPTIGYNLAKAKQLLSTVPNANAQITFGYASKYATQDLEIINELKAAGFNVKGVEEPDFGTYINNALDGKYDLYFFAELTTTNDGLDIINTLVVGNSNYDNAQIDSLVDQAGSTLNTSQRINDMQQIATIVSKEIPLVSLYEFNRTLVAKPNLVINSDFPLDTGSYFWKTYQN